MERRAPGQGSTELPDLAASTPCDNEGSEAIYSVAEVPSAAVPEASAIDQEVSSSGK